MGSVNGDGRSSGDVVFVELAQALRSCPARVTTKDRTTDEIPLDFPKGAVGIVCDEPAPPDRAVVAFEHGKFTATTSVPRDILLWPPESQPAAK